MAVQKRGEIQTLQIGYVVTCSAYLLFDFCFRAGATPTDYDENTSHAGVNTTSAEDSGDSKIAEDEGTPLGFILMFPSILFFAFGFISGPTQLSIASRCAPMSSKKSYRARMRASTPPARSLGRC
jgi:hypothetical protein